MSTETPYEIGRPHLSALDLYRLCRAYVELAREAVARPAVLTEGAFWRVIDHAAQAALGPASAETLASHVAQEWRNLALDLAAVPGAAAAGMADRLFHGVRTRLSEYPIHIEGSAPRNDALAVPLDYGTALRQRRALAERAGFAADDPALWMPDLTYGAPFVLPARVLDASQAWATWFVPLEAARGLLRDAVRTGHLPDRGAEFFEPLDCGLGRAMVSLLVSDYRVSDFGVTREIGLTLTVTPAGEVVADPGQIFLRLIVTDAFSVAPARQIWGLRKDLWLGRPDTAPQDRVQITYRPDHMEARIGTGRWLREREREAQTLAIRFPRFGSTRSDRAPGTIYSFADAEGAGTEAASGASATPVRATLLRSGSGEGVQFGGPVRLSLPRDGRATGCLCSGGMACLCATLGALGLDRKDARPAANGWTEHMRCRLDAPLPLVGQESPGNSAR